KAFLKTVCDGLREQRLQRQVLQEKLKAVERQFSDASSKQDKIKLLLEDFAAHTLANTKAEEHIRAVLDNLEAWRTSKERKEVARASFGTRSQDMTSEEGKNVEKKNRLGRTELHNAVCRGDETCVRQLLRNRAAVDAKDGSGRTPLHLASDAASEVGVKLIELLLEARATTDATDLSGLEPQPLSSSELMNVCDVDVDCLGFLGLTPLNLACDSKYTEAVAVLQSVEGSSRVPEELAEEHLNTQCAEISDYFAKRYLAGELYDGSGYSNSNVGELLTYKYEASDGDVMVWQHAFDLRAFGKQGEEVVTLYHYTDELAFHNVGNLEQTAAQLFASLVDERAHFGKGLYATQHEPAVWASRLRILLNNYSNGDPFSPTPEEARKRDAEWGNGRKSGHRAAFCIPLIVPRSIAYNIFERHTPDMAEKTVKDSAGQERPIKLGEDYLGRPVHRNRDVWVIRVETDFWMGKCSMQRPDSVLDLLQLRLRKLRASAGEDVLMADCMFELARRLYGRARYGEAEKLDRECLRIRQVKLGEDHLDTLPSLNNLAMVLQAQGRLVEAEPLYREALEKRQAKLGEDHPDTLNSINNLALLLYAQGHLAEAEPLFRKALEKSKAKLGEDHPDTLLSLNSLNNLALLLQDQGRLVEAEPLYREALEKSPGAQLQRFQRDFGQWTWSHTLLDFRTAKLGEDHPDTLTSLNNLALLLYAQGHLAEAEPLFRKALEKSKAKLGEDHPDTLNSINNLAAVLDDQGHLAEAEPLYREALEKRKAQLGEDHPDTLNSINNLAAVLDAQGHLAEAEPLYREALEKRQAKLGEDHPDTLNSLNNLAAVLKAQGHLAEAEPFLREALKKRKAKLGEDHPDTLLSLNNLAAVLKAQGHLAEAEPLYREALEKGRLKLGKQHPNTMMTIYNLAVLLKSMKKFEEAEELFREELAACISRHGEHHEETLDSMENLAEFLEERGKVDEAQELLHLAGRTAQ
ncbi:unnamed protein product, partial [Cladocopium goreaui]